MNPEIQKEIDYWAAQYLAANGTPHTDDVTYEHGWIVFRRFGAPIARWRRRDFANMAEILRQRAERKGTT